MSNNIAVEAENDADMVVIDHNHEDDFANPEVILIIRLRCL